MKFLADRGIAWRIVEWLRQHKHDAIHLRELNLHRMLDNKIFAKAEQEKVNFEMSDMNPAL